MEELKIMKYYRKIIQYRSELFSNVSEGMNCKFALCQFLDEKRSHDKNLNELVDFFIKIGIFTHKDTGYIIKPDSKKIAREMLEGTESYKLIESLYDIKQDKRKGTYF